VGFKLVEGEGLREGWDSKELWKSFEKAKAAKGSQLKVESTRGPRRGREFQQLASPYWLTLNGYQYTLR
jgi:hypothetical protein